MSQYHQNLVVETVKQTRALCDFSVKWILSHLEIKPATYYKWLKTVGNGKNKKKKHPDMILPEEREAVIAYAREHTNIRHRELTWRMVDDNIAFLSMSSVYKILKESGLICGWKAKNKRQRIYYEQPKSPDEKWQSDIRYVAVNKRTYYMITFIDEHSRYVTHHEVMPSMDGNSVSLAALTAINKLKSNKKPIIQTDNGSCYISYDFKKVLNKNGVGHHRIRPHCPEENGIVERANRTLKEASLDYEFKNLAHARSVIDEIVRYYNEERLHSSLDFLRPKDYYRGNPEQLLKERKAKLFQARHKRREMNMNIKQQSLALNTSEINDNYNLFQRTKSLLLS